MGLIACWGRTLCPVLSGTQGLGPAGPGEVEDRHHAMPEELQGEQRTQEIVMLRLMRLHKSGSMFHLVAALQGEAPGHSLTCAGTARAGAVALVMT